MKNIFTVLIVIVFFNACQKLPPRWSSPSRSNSQWAIHENYGYALTSTVCINGVLDVRFCNTDSAGLAPDTSRRYLSFPNVPFVLKDGWCNIAANKGVTIICYIATRKNVPFKTEVQYGIYSVSKRLIKPDVEFNFKIKDDSVCDNVNAFVSNFKTKKEDEIVYVPIYGSVTYIWGVVGVYNTHYNGFVSGVFE